MPGLLSPPLVHAPARVDLVSPVDLTAPLNRGLLNWHLVVPHQLGGVVWRNLVAPRHATLVGTEPRSATQGWHATGRQGGWGEVRLNGTSSYAAVASASIYDVANTTFTVSCWMRATTDAHLVARRHATVAVGGWFLRLDAAGTATARLIASNGTNVAQRSTVVTTLLSGAWAHLVVVFTTSTTVSAANDMVLFVNGQVNQGTRSTAGSVYADTVDALTFGSVAPFTGVLTGAMDDVRFYTRGLTATEVQQLYQASRTGYPRELRWLRPARLLLATAAWVTMAADPGSVVLAATDAGLPVTLPATAGAITLAGTAAALSVLFPAAAGAVTIAGTDAAFATDLTPTLLAESGSVAVAGTDGALGVGFLASAGTVTLAGTAAVLDEAGTVPLAGAAGSVVISGTPVLLFVTMPADPGAIVTTFAGVLLAAPGTITVTGTDAVLTVIRPPTPLLTFPSVVAQGRERGVSQAVVVASQAEEEGARLIATAVLQTGTRIQMVIYECTASFGTTNGLTAVDIGDPAVPDRWGHHVGITEDARTTYADGQPGDVVLDTPGDVWVSAVGGAFDAAGACTLSILWERAAVS